MEIALTSRHFALCIQVQGHGTTEMFLHLPQYKLLRHKFDIGHYRI